MFEPNAAVITIAPHGALAQGERLTIIKTWQPPPEYTRTTNSMGNAYTRKIISPRLARAHHADRSRHTIPVDRLALADATYTPESPTIGAAIRLKKPIPNGPPAGAIGAITKIYRQYSTGTDYVGARIWHPPAGMVLCTYIPPHNLAPYTPQEPDQKPPPALPPKGARMRVINRYASIPPGTTGTVTKAWVNPRNGAPWARLFFGRNLTGQELTQAIPLDCLKAVEPTQPTPAGTIGNS